MCNGLCAGCTLLAVHTGAAAGADVRAALGGIDSAKGRQRTIDIDFDILQIRIGTIISLARCISYGLEFAGTPDKVVGIPLVAVVNIDGLSAGHCQISTLGNVYLDASQQRGILSDGDLAGLDIDGNIIGDGQHIACRINAHTGKLQGQRIQLCLTVDRKDQTVGLFIIVLGEAAGNHLKHAVVTNEIDGGGICGAHCVNAAVNFLVSASIQGQGHFNILHEVLREGEYLIAHVGGRAAAAEVCDLIELIYGCTGFSQHRTAAGNKAPCIEITAALDCNGAVICHFDIAVITNRASLLAAASGKIPAAQADGAIDGNRSALAHRQRPERFRCRGRADCRRRIRVQRPRSIKGNQKCNTGRNGIGTADSAIGSQRNLRLTVRLRIGNCIIQIVKRLSAGLKERQLLADEPRRDGAVAFNVQGCLGGGIDVLPLGHIVPAHELIARRRGRRHLIGGHGALRIGVHLGDGLPVHGIGAVLGGLEGHGGAHVVHQCHVGHGDLGGSAGAAGFDVDLDAGVGRQLLGELAARRDPLPVHLNGAAVLLNGIVEGQRRLCGSLVGDGQRRVIMCVAAGSARAGGRADNLRAGGSPRTIRAAVEAQADVFIGKTGYGSACCCKCRQRNGRH